MGSVDNRIVLCYFPHPPKIIPEKKIFYKWHVIKNDLLVSVIIHKMEFLQNSKSKDLDC